jgi:hypothetical protein
MIMRIIILVLTSLTILLTASSCEDFLDRDPEDKISNEGLFKDMEGVNYALAGAYNGLTDDNYYRKNFILVSGLKGGNIKFSSNIVEMYLDRYRDTYNFDHSPADQQTAYYAYRQIYEVLDMINNIIHNIPDAKGGTQAEKDHVMGEAKALRALCHFDACRLFAQRYGHTSNAQHLGVVIVRKSPDVFDQPERATVYDSYKFIVQDLKEAIELLESTPEQNKSEYWIDATAAKALLARVYLYKEDWNNAIDMATQVIEDNNHSLVGHNQYVEKWNQNEFNEEQIWILDNSYELAEALSKYIGVPGISDKTQMTLSHDLLDLYGDDDVRGQLITTFENDTVSTKYRSSNNIESNIPMIRLAEMYLIRAEASARVGEEIQARSDLDAIRKRANPQASFPNYSGQELIDQILKEKRKELALEGHLFFDLKRLGRDIVRTDCNATKNQNLEYPNPNLVMPIPKDEMDYNENMTQNEGY